MVLLSMYWILLECLDGRSVRKHLLLEKGSQRIDLRFELAQAWIDLVIERCRRVAGRE
jgi:hypothetical protein